MRMLMDYTTIQIYHHDNRCHYIYTIQIHHHDVRVLDMDVNKFPHATLKFFSLLYNLDDFGIEGVVHVFGKLQFIVSIYRIGKENMFH